MTSNIDSNSKAIPQPTWFPKPEFIATTNLAHTMHELAFDTYEQLYRWSVDHYVDFWDYIIKKLNIEFTKPYSRIVDLTNGVENPNWLPDAKFNIANSCFNAPPDAIAIINQTENGVLETLTYNELNKLSNRVANSILKYFKPSDAIAICMPMTPICIAIYLGIIKAGCIVVSIADSFAPDEIAIRLKISNAKAIFMQDRILRGNKSLICYKKISAVKTARAIVIPVAIDLCEQLREQDINWNNFLSDNSEFAACECEPSQTINILFSSGTTGDPKAIPWTHTTAIKAASDAYFHHNIQPGDRLAWYTNLGWMMGPWLIFASLLNQATIALFDGTPLARAYGEFIQNSKVTMLGIVPTLVKTWRATKCMEGLDWNNLKLFSSTGECSNTDDMLYLMSLANNKPIIEYCGGTEIGGAYITSTVIQSNAPAAFTTPTLGLDFVLIDDNGKVTDNGEVALIPPSIGLSNQLLNKDHYQTYYADMPTVNGKILRRHGDQIQKFTNGFYRALGRADDTMNLGGIKTSSAEIERTLTVIPTILETAAIAVNPPDGGPSHLVIYAVPKPDQQINIIELKNAMQILIKDHLNPLFKIHDIVLIDTLPRTASNKVMRRVLRDEYEKNIK